MSPVDPVETREHWDSLAAAYDEAKARNDFYYRFLKSLVSRWVQSASPRAVLDVGCGTGQLLAYLNPDKGLGIDVSPAMVTEAARRFGDRKNLEFRVWRAEEAGDLGQFEAVFSADVLEHVSDWRATVQSMVEALAPRGRLVLTTPNPRWAGPLWLLEKLRLKMPEGPHHFVASRPIASLLAQLGCTILHRGTYLLVPTELGGLGPKVSWAAAQMPIVRSCGVIQLVVARR